jgi:deazaflavin-dependent oxidoreductase (nitroreductase family)
MRIRPDTATDLDALEVDVTQLDQPTDSPRDWVVEHTRRYLATDGADGFLWRGVPTLLLTTIGRKTGRARRTALIFGRDGDNYLLVASRGGAAHHPQWYLNLAANPDVQIQVKGELIRARARTATAEEKPRLWRIMAEIYPPYDEYQRRTTREIPLIVLEPTG